MKMGYHKDHMGEALFDADRVMVLKPKELDWDVKASLSTANASVFSTIDEIIDQAKLIETGHIVVMSNGSFDGLIDKLINSY
jgi:UDP-N-acetylmuramate: L-alanyl-gamma-D-glutamyl-meso-diaminopimelate ligase